MKKVLSKLFGRLVLTGIIILIQFGWIAFTLYEAGVVNPWFSIGLRLVSLVCALYVVYKDMRPHSKMSWIFLILLLPFIGCPCYFLFGRSEMTKKNREQIAELQKFVEPMREEQETVIAHLKMMDDIAYKQMSFPQNTGRYPVYMEKDSKYYSVGDDMFVDMIEDIKKAKDFIFLEFFIMKQGVMFDTLIDALAERVKAGVHVRLIYDDMGCIDEFPLHFYKELQAKGIHVACFNPFRPFMSIIMNNRDHRKIMVVDGKIAYTGGLNIADEYINAIERFGHWKDAGVRITGDAVWSFTTMFLEMWSYVTTGTEDFSRFKVVENDNQMLIQQQKGFVQPYGDCPLDKRYLIEGIYLNLINHARKNVYIFTPYLILGSEIATALINAARSGVDVRIVTPAIPDKKMVFLLTQSNYENLIQGGVKIYQYTPGFIHSKCFVVDDEYASVGTTNLDFRALYLHFECGVLMYKTESVHKVTEDMLETFGKSREILLEECENKNFFYQLFLSVMRLFSPLL
ncbi:MAG: cardiolipin synthase [Agathobacter sp.]|nr:cardiolipin synthase [Agathobacter sp.]